MKSWEDLLIKELHRNSDKIDSFISDFVDKHKEVAEQNRTIILEQDNMKSEHRRMNDLLEIHIEGVKLNRDRLDRFEYKLEPVLNEIAPILEEFRGKKYLKEYRKTSYKDLTVKLTIFSLFVSLLTGMMKFTGVF